MFHVSIIPPFTISRACVPYRSPYIFLNVLISNIDNFASSPFVVDHCVLSIQLYNKKKKYYWSVRTAIMCVGDEREELRPN